MERYPTEGTFICVRGCVYFINNVNGGLIDNLQDQCKNIGAHVGTKTQKIGFNAEATNIGPGAGGIINNHGPGAGGLNSGPGAGSINASSVDRATWGTRIRHRRTTNTLSKQQLREIFTNHSEDKTNVKLVREELKAAFECLGAQLPTSQAACALKNLQSNNPDGNITAEELDGLVDYAYANGFFG